MNMIAKTALAAAFCTAMAASPALAFGPERFDVDEVRLGKMVAEVDLRVDANARDVTVEITGPDEWLRRAEVRRSGKAVEISQDLPDGDGRNIHMDDDDHINVRITAPPGTDLHVGDMIGTARVGDLDGDLNLDLGAAASLEIGRVRSANVRVRGAVDLTLREVTQSLDARISGVGNTEIGNVRGPVDFAISGMGNVEIGRVDGPVRVSLSGAGSVDIADGRADPLEVSVSGVGSFDFDGVAVQQTVSRSGLGNISINGRRPD